MTDCAALGEDILHIVATEGGGLVAASLFATLVSAGSCTSSQASTSERPLHTISSALTSNLACKQPSRRCQVHFICRANVAVRPRSTQGEHHLTHLRVTGRRRW